MCISSVSSNSKGWGDLEKELQASGCRYRCSSDPLPVPAPVALYHQTDRGLGLTPCSLQHEALYIEARECKG